MKPVSADSILGFMVGANLMKEHKNLRIHIDKFNSENAEKINNKTEFSKKIGVQSVVVILDIKKKLFGGYDIVINNGKKKTGINLIEFVKKIQKIGIKRFTKSTRLTNR